MTYDEWKARAPEGMPQNRPRHKCTVCGRGGLHPRDGAHYCLEHLIEYLGTRTESSK